MIAFFSIAAPQGATVVQGKSAAYNRYVGGGTAMALQQRVVRFGGQVQGVGFRFTTCRVAAGYEVTGYVRNLPDGRVECVAEGTDEEIDAFLGELRRAMGGYIRDHTEETAAYTGQFREFGVRL
jgi:acylphosphatase